MFDFLFGWGKASKCKKLIKRVRCRLKLLKNKRSTIVRQLKEDVSLLLKDGHDQIAFNRVEQIFMDENIVTVYDLLDQFCDVIIINFSYIRKKKDCPNDINEAISSLIYASARFGDLPELPVIRELFKDRYGQRFATTALELLPGNLVNRQVRDSLSVMTVPDDVKYRLLDDIARRRSCIQTGLLALECSSELRQQQQANNCGGDQIPKSGNRNKEPPLQVSINPETEGNIICVDLSKESKKLLIEKIPSRQNSDGTGTSNFSSANSLPSPYSVDSSTPGKEEKIENVPCPSFPCEITVLGQSNTGESWNSSKIHTDVIEYKVESMSPESSSGNSADLSEEMIFLDDIEELRSPITNDRYQDQRLFKFKSFSMIPKQKFDDGSNEVLEEQYESWKENAGSRSRKTGKANGKRLRKRSVSQERFMDFDCATYYGKSFKILSNHNHEAHYWRKHQKKISAEANKKPCCAQDRKIQRCCHECSFSPVRSPCTRCFEGQMAHVCSLDHPCYLLITDGKDSKSPSWIPEKIVWGVTDTKPGPVIHYSAFHGKGVSRNHPRVQYLRLTQRATTTQKGAVLFDNLSYQQQNEKLEGEWGSSSPWTRTETKASYSRTVTMPPERLKDGCSDNIMMRLNSFPFQQPNTHLNNASSSPSHVHPKLPDYDELAATFMALKKANLQKKACVGRTPRTLRRH